MHVPEGLLQDRRGGLRHSGPHRTLAAPSRDQQLQRTQPAGRAQQQQAPFDRWAGAAGCSRPGSENPQQAYPPQPPLGPTSAITRTHLSHHYEPPQPSLGPTSAITRTHLSHHYEPPQPSLGPTSAITRTHLSHHYDPSQPELGPTSAITRTHLSHH